MEPQTGTLAAGQYDASDPSLSDFVKSSLPEDISLTLLQVCEILDQMVRQALNFWLTSGPHLLPERYTYNLIEEGIHSERINGSHLPKQTLLLPFIEHGPAVEHVALPCRLVESLHRF
mmetsp:Transcript_23068/g.35709  ORF Transcript_23068/g.35709 Transcript_23068/m.35709 type:complete len:118 (-) Transcript_23068:81-434(-)